LWRSAISTTGSTIASPTSATAGTATVKPIEWLSATSSGAMVKPAALAPFSARLIARPRRRSNHSDSVVAMATVVVPAQPAAIGTTQTNICQGALTLLSSTAPMPRISAPPPSTTRGPNRSMARCTRVIRQAPVR
jgi:hypothetical protein